MQLTTSGKAEKQSWAQSAPEMMRQRTELFLERHLERRVESKIALADTTEGFRSPPSNGGKAAKPSTTKKNQPGARNAPAIRMPPAAE
jgi:hypothetical protein